METVFLDILKNSKDTIHRICQAYAADSEDARDLFQEVLLQLWRALPSFRGEAAVNTWVYRIALNVCLREKNKQQNRIRSQYLLPAPEASMPEAKEYRELYTCIRKLDETDRSIILLFLEELSYKEIAAITGLTENHIAVKIKRIKTKLFNCLKPIL